MGRQLGTIHSITMSGTSQATAAFGSQTRCIRIATGAQPGYFDIGSAPTATTSSNLIGATCVDDIGVAPGQKLAALEAGSGGVITVTEYQ